MPKPFTGLWTLFRAHPGRTAVCSVVPLLLAGAQGTNALVHGAPAAPVAAFVAAMVAVAVVATRQSLASFRTETLEAGLFEDA